MADPRPKAFDSAGALWQGTAIATPPEAIPRIDMPKEEWGTKRVCPTTGKRFYDLNRVPVVSPYTGEVVNLDAPKTRTIVAEKASKEPARELDELDDDVILDDDSDVDLDDELLEDDEDDNVSLDDIADVGGEDEEP